MRERIATGLAALALGGLLLTGLTPVSRVPAAHAAGPGPSSTQLVSVAGVTPPQGGDSPSGSVDISGVSSISSDGRYVAFATKSTNMVVANPTGRSQVYVRDTVTGTTRLVSATSTGAPGDLTSSRPSISGDGTKVAFLSSATDLVSGVSDRIPHVFLWSSETGTSTVIDVSNTAGHDVGNSGVPSEMSLSRDGNAVVFTSGSTNLTTEDNRGFGQVFVRDIAAGTTTMASIESAGKGARLGAFLPSVSSDGSVVGFISAASLTPTDVHSIPQVFLRNVPAGTTTLASVSADAVTGANRPVESMTMSGDATLVAFGSSASNLTTSRGTGGGYIRDTTTAMTRDLAPKFSLSNLRLSTDGQHLAFDSISKVVPEVEGLPSTNRAYLLDIATGVFKFVGMPASGTTSRTDRQSYFPVPSDDGQFVAFTSNATNLTPETATGIDQVYIRNTAADSRIDRLGGADRYAVSAATSADTFPADVDRAFVASGQVFPDALSASAAAGAAAAPVLLTQADLLPAAVQAELRRLHPLVILLMGGTNTVSSDIENQLRTFSRSGVIRIAGADRYEVSANASQAVFFAASPPVAYVASGEVFPDALSGSAAAGALKGPVLLVQKGAVPASVAAELKRLAPTKIIVLGGTNTVSDGVLTALNQVAPTTRVGGADRYAVSAAVSAGTFPANTTTVYVASGAVFPDALSGSAAAIRRGAPVLLVTADGIPAVIATELRRLNPRHIVVLGGTNTVSAITFDQLRGYLAH